MLVRREKARMGWGGGDGGSYSWAEGVWRAPVQDRDRVEARQWGPVERKDREDGPEGISVVV